MNDYLQRLKWDGGGVSTWVRDYLINMRVVVLLIIALAIGGFASYKTLPQTVAPEINLTLLVVSASLPGATPEDVEALLTIPLENELKSVDGLDTVQSTSNNSFASVVMTFVRGIDKDRALADVEAALSRIGELPEDATEPRVEAVDFEDAPVVQWTFSSDAASANALGSRMQKLIDQLEADQKIDRVVAGGQPVQEVQILISPEALQTYGLSVSTIRSAVLSGVATLPSGTVNGAGIERSVSIDASVESVQELRELPIIVSNSTSQIITLGDVATIVERPEPGTTSAYLNDGGEDLRTVTLDVYRVSGVDISDAVASALQISEDFMAVDGEGLVRYEIYNGDTELSDQFNDLMRNLGTTAVLVFITLTLFVGRRQAFLASISIPLIYSIAFISMQVTGISVNFLSLFSLMLSLGLLVDVTIVIVSAMTTYMREGTFSAHKTGILVFRDFFKTLIVTTLTTVWAFVPLLLAGGIIGEYIKPIPVVVSSVLLASVIVGFFVILPLMIWLFNFNLPGRVRVLLRIVSVVATIALCIYAVSTLKTSYAVMAVVAGVALLVSGWISFGRSGVKKTPKAELEKSQKVLTRDTPKTFINLTRLQGLYRRALEQMVASRVARWKTIGVVVVFFASACIIAAKFVPNEFFPGGENTFLYVSVEMPDGTKSEISEEKTKSLLPILAGIDGVSYATMQVGFRASGDDGTGRSSDNNVAFTLKTPTSGEGSRGSQAVAKEVRDHPAIKDFVGGEISVVEVSGGPPAGADITVTFVGDELATLQSLAKELRGLMGDMPVENIVISPGSAAAIVAFEPDDYLLARQGISRGDISNTIRLFTAGITIDEDVEFDGLSDKRDIVLRSTSGDANLTDIGLITIKNSAGEAIPLDALGSVSLTENITEINREDFDRTVSVTASTVGEANAGEISDQIAEVIDGEMSLPNGYTWKTGGANEENNESVASIIQGMGLAGALIFLTLIIHLRSYRKAAIVLMTIPLAISGVFIVFGVVGIPLSFPSLIGILALFGIVVNNAIIIISQINANREVGLSFHEAVLSGSASRLEPILLSSLTTIIGLIPITISDPIWRGLGGAIISGLTFSGMIMLFFIPTVYYMMMSDEDTDRIN